MVWRAGAMGPQLNTYRVCRSRRDPGGERVIVGAVLIRLLGPRLVMHLGGQLPGQVDVAGGPLGQNLTGAALRRPAGQVQR